MAVERQRGSNLTRFSGFRSVARRILAVALLQSLGAYGFSLPVGSGMGAKIGGWYEVDSVYTSKGMTCHDGLVGNLSANISDFRVGDTVLPAFIGYWGILSLSESKKFPKEKPGRWVEADTYAGVDTAKFFDWKEYVSLKMWWLRWNFPDTGRKPTDMCAFDVTLIKCPLHPTTSWRYRFHGASEGRFEVKAGVFEEYGFTEDWFAFSGLTLWYVNYKNENPARSSGLSCGDVSLGLRWKMFYVKATYYFQLDPDVVKKGHQPYNYDENLVFGAGFRFAF